MAMIHVSRSGAQLGIFDEARVREGLTTGEFIGTDLGWTAGMATWRPLSELESFQTVPPPPATLPEAAEPTAEPAAQMTAAPTAAAAVEATGLPWENRARIGFLPALSETVVMVLLHPEQAFRVMRREGGLTDPLLFVLIMGSLGGLASFAFSAMLHAAGIGATHSPRWAAMFGLGVASFFMLLLVPVFVVIGSFVSAAIAHLCLMLLGGANRPFETTLRVICFSGGSANLLQLVPMCGGLLAGLWSLVLNCIGLARAHETDTWRAVLAVLLPMLVCCGGGVFLMVLLIGSFAGAAGWNH
ncbi:MAG: YIP1 family protein [Verrucomicrobiota bacterium]|nr:YIP1 family protein [Verrucomicrobiota bacterium]